MTAQYHVISEIRTYFEISGFTVIYIPRFGNYLNRAIGKLEVYTAGTVGSFFDAKPQEVWIAMKFLSKSKSSDYNTFFFQRKKCYDTFYIFQAPKLSNYNTLFFKSKN